MSEGRRAIAGRAKPRIYAGIRAVPSVIAVGHRGQLLAQGQDLEMERGPAPQEVDQGREQGNKYRFHAGNAT